MPHLKIQDSGSLADLFPRLEPLEAKDERGVQKIRAFFIDREEKQILAEGMVAEGGLPRYFFLSLQQKEGALLLRCLPSTDPEKTPGVKRLILRLGLAISELLNAGMEPCNLEGEWEAFRACGE